MIELELAGDYKKVAAIQEAEEDKLLAMDNVVGTAVGHKVKGDVDTGDVCLSVFVASKLPTGLLKSGNTIPRTVSKMKTDVVETGEIFAGAGEMAVDTAITESESAAAQTLKSRVRPVEGGYSIGHYKITAGTHATAVIDRAPFPGIPSRYYTLSNNHVLANSNKARLGDPILQPGPIDGGKLPFDVVARLARFVPIRFNGRCNYVDAAIGAGPFEWLDREIYWVGYVKGRAQAQVGMIVQKTGRTTNYTTGRVTAINATVNVNYGGGNVAKMCRQIVTTNMSAGGDSGSLLCDMNERAVGLLFAGSSAVTIHNHIGFVESMLGIRVV